MSRKIQKNPGDLISIVPYLSLYLSVLSLGCVWTVPVKQRNNSQERFLRPMHTKVSAYNRGDYAKAPREFHKAAEQGHADAQFMLELMYEVGAGVPKNYTVAVK